MVVFRAGWAAFTVTYGVILVAGRTRMPFSYPRLLRASNAVKGDGFVRKKICPPHTAGVAESRPSPRVRWWRSARNSGPAVFRMNVLPRLRLVTYQAGRPRAPASLLKPPGGDGPCQNLLAGRGPRSKWPRRCRFTHV